MQNQLMVLSESSALRQKVCTGEAIKLLDKCGNLAYLSKLEAVTKATVCRYYGVPVVTLNKLLQRHREELVHFGYNILSKKDLENETRCLISKELFIPNRGIAIFPPASILCIGLLLRDSEVAKNLRSVIWQNLLSKKEEYLDEEVLLESRTFRDGYCTDDNLSILDLVGLLATLPNTAWSTVVQVAEYYRVDKNTIEVLVFRNKSELQQDGYRILKKKDFKNLQDVSFTDITIPRRGLAIIPRQGILRIAMLLRDSEVAKKIRSYLLHAESLAPWRQEKGAATSVPVPYATKADLQILSEQFRQEIREMEERRKGDMAKQEERLEARRKEDLEALEKRLEERRKKDMARLEKRLAENMDIVFSTLKEQEDRWSTDLGFLHGLLKDQDSRQQKAMAELEKMWKEDIDTFFTKIFRQEERWSMEFWGLITRGNTEFENQLEEFRSTQDRILKELEAIKKKL